MVRLLIGLLTVLVSLSATSTVWGQSKQPKVKMETSLGTIIIVLDAKAAPKTVENFLSYVDDGFYNNTIFHRVIQSFMIQGGGLTADMRKKPTRDPIPNEADNGLKNTPGTIAMARTAAPHSATAQFFINAADNRFLNHKNKTPQGWGYCVFGRVTQGMQVVKAIETVPTGVHSGRRDVPTTPVAIHKVTRLMEAKPPTN